VDTVAFRRTHVQELQQWAQWPFEGPMFKSSNSGHSGPSKDSCSRAPTVGTVALRRARVNIMRMSRGSYQLRSRACRLNHRHRWCQLQLEEVCRTGCWERESDFSNVLPRSHRIRLHKVHAGISGYWLLVAVGSLSPSENSRSASTFFCLTP
jgi:hypothetical protein